MQFGETLQGQIYPAVIRIYDQIETERHFYNESKANGKLMVIFVCEGQTRLVDLETTSHPRIVKNTMELIVEKALSSIGSKRGLWLKNPPNMLLKDLFSIPLRSLVCGMWLTNFMIM